MQLVKQLEEKTKEAAKNREAAENVMGDVEELIKKAKDMDANVSEAQKFLLEAAAAMENKSYEKSYSLAQKAEKTVKSAIEDTINRMIESVSNLMDLASKIGTETEDVQREIEKARDSIEMEDYDSALEHVQKAWEDGERNLHEYMAEVFSTAQSLIVLARNYGEDVTSAEEALSKARGGMDSNDYELAISITKDCLETTSHILKDRINKSLDEALDFIDIFDDLGIKYEEIEKMIVECKKLRDDDDFEAALKISSKIIGESERLLEGTVNDEIHSIKNEIQEAKGINADVSKARKLADKATAIIKDSGDFREVYRTLQDAREALSKAQFQAVLTAVAVSRPKFVTAKKIGADIKKGMDYLNQARDSLNSGDYKKAIEFANLANEEVERLIKNYKDAEEEMKRITESFKVAERIGADVGEAKDLIVDARGALQMKDFKKALEIVQKTRDYTYKAEYEKAMEYVEAAELVIGTAEKIGLDISGPQEILESAISLIQSHDYLKGIKEAEKARESGEKVLRNGFAEGVARLKEIMETQPDVDTKAIKAKIKAAETKFEYGDLEGAFEELAKGRELAEGAERIAFNSLLTEINEHFKALEKLEIDVALFEKSLKEVEKTGEVDVFNGKILAASLVEDMKRLETRKLNELFEKAKKDIITAKKSGVDVAGARDAVKNAKKRLEEGKLLASIELIITAVTDLQEEMKGHKELVIKFSEVADKIREAKDLNAEVRESTKLLLQAKDAFAKRDRKKAEELLDMCLKGVEIQMELYKAAKAVMAAKELLAMTKKLELNTEKEEKLLKIAAEFMRKKNYASAKEAADEAAEDLKNYLKNGLNSTIKTSESIIKEARDIGIEITVAEDMLKEAKGFLELEKFAQAFKYALLARREVEEVKNISQQAARKIKEAHDILSEADAVSADVTHLRDKLKEAMSLLKSNKYQEAFDTSQEVVSETSEVIDERLNNIIGKCEASISKVKETGMSVLSPENMLQKAKDSLEAREYREALNYVVEAEKQVENAELQFEIASGAVEAAKKKLNTLGDSASDKLKKKLSEAKEALKTGHYPQAINLSMELNDAVHAIDEEKRELGDRISEYAGSLEKLRVHGEDVGAVEKGIESAWKLLSDGDVKGAKKETKTLREKLVNLQEKILQTKGEEVKNTLALKIIREGADEIDELFEKSGRAFKDGNLDEALEHMLEAHEKMSEFLNSDMEARLAEARAKVKQAENSGTDTKPALEAIEEAEKKIAEKDYTAAIELLNTVPSLIEQHSEGRKLFTDMKLTIESDLASARKFGVNTKDVEKLLKEALQLEEKDFNAAFEKMKTVAEKASEKLNAFSPDLEIDMDLPELTLDEWSDAKIIVKNRSKAMGKKLKVRIEGDVAVRGLKPAGNIKGNGSVEIGFEIRPKKAGKLSIKGKASTSRVFDDKEYVIEFERSATAKEKVTFEILKADKEYKCGICHGKIKPGMDMIRCQCGATYHKSCGERNKECPVCHTPFVKKKKARKKVALKI